MKKTIRRLLALLLCISLLSVALLGCGSGKTLMSLDGCDLSLNIYRLMLSRLRGTMEYNYSEAANSTFWDIIIDADGTTYNDYFTASVLENAKTYLAAVYVHDKVEKMTLPESTLTAIDEEIAGLMNDTADGSKTEFNAILSEFGVNMKMLREAYIMEAKVEALQEKLYGKNGSLISDAVKEEYYQANYTRFKHVFLFTYVPVYITDENGDSVYYGDGNHIAYDKTVGTPRAGTDGEWLKDGQGDVIYYTADGRIAYDKTSGLRAYAYDENGYVQYRQYTDKECEAVAEKAEKIYERALSGEDFDYLVDNFNEDIGLKEYTNGFYLTADSEYEVKEVLEALPDMAVGEIRLIRSDYGYHVLKKYELDKGAYADSVNADFFTDFSGNLITQLFLGRIATYAEMVVVDESLLDGVDVKHSAANYYY